jgi:hypothetical protein
MRVLITNITLAGRTGTETYVRDLATALLKRGHNPVVYTPNPGEIADEIRAQTVPVVDRLDRIGQPPDIIHGHHTPTTMSALLQFQESPAIFFCHDWSAWHDAPPRFPRIKRYVAVDYTCRDRLLQEHGIEESRIEVLYNAVDLDRFPPRGPLPVRPRRALVFSNYLTEGPQLSALRDACSCAGVSVDLAGSGFGKSARAPEAALGDYDVVFGKARCAIEAMAVGAAVILCDAAGLGPMVTTGNLDSLRRINFGRRALRSPVHADSVFELLNAYDALDAAEVSRRIRAEAGLDRLLDRLTNLYREVIKEHRNAEIDRAKEARAVAEYIQSLVPRLWSDTLEHELARFRGQLSVQVEIESGLAAAEQELNASRVQFETDRSRLERELEQANAELGQIKRSVGWRLLSLYGPVKYRVVLPLYRRVAGFFGSRGTIPKTRRSN